MNEGGQGSGAEEEEEEEGGGVHAASSCCTMQLFTLIASLSESYLSLTVERPSQQAITTTSVPRPHIVSTA